MYTGVHAAEFLWTHIYSVNTHSSVARTIQHPVKVSSCKHWGEICPVCTVAGSRNKSFIAKNNGSVGYDRN